MKFLISISLLFLIIACKETRENHRGVSSREFDTEFKIDTTIKFKDVRHVAYGYSFSYPLGFQEVIDTIGQVDSSIFYSGNKNAKIKFFIEGNKAPNKDLKDQSEQNYFNTYIDSLKEGKHIVTRNSKVLKLKSNFRNYSYGNAASFMIMGERDTTEYVFKSELSEVPISGDLTFKNFLIEYPKSLKNYYRPIAIQIAKKFGQ